MNARPPFSYDAPFVARRDFMHDGVEYKDGAPFQWRELGLTETQLFNLWATSYVDTGAIAVPSTATSKQQRQARR